MIEAKSIKAWLGDNKRGLLIGFLFGALIAPFLALLGLGIPFFEFLRPLLIGPLDLIKSLIPSTQVGPDSYTVPAYKWALTLGFNGVCYALFGGLIQAFSRSRKIKE